jgi:hypothetical protein
VIASEISSCPRLRVLNDLFHLLATNARSRDDSFKNLPRLGSPHALLLANDSCAKYLKETTIPGISVNQECGSHRDSLCVLGLQLREQIRFSGCNDCFVRATGKRRFPKIPSLFARAFINLRGLFETMSCCHVKVDGMKVKVIFWRKAIGFRAGLLADSSKRRQDLIGCSRFDS